MSDVLQIILSLQVLQPVRWPAGFDAWPVLQQSVILPKFRVAISRQPTEPEETIHMQRQTAHITSEPNMVSPLAHPYLKRKATVGNTVTSASVKDGPARWDWGPSLKGKTMETVKYVKIWHASLTSMCYLLKVTLPQVELSDQGFFISLQSRVMPLFFRHIPVIEDHGS